MEQGPRVLLHIESEDRVEIMLMAGEASVVGDPHQVAAGNEEMMEVIEGRFSTEKLMLLTTLAEQKKPVGEKMVMKGAEVSFSREALAVKAQTQVHHRSSVMLD